ncbi:glycosyltransferase family 4 protein [Candidatus Woesearchaeota archaeon]|nr:glycosyltransferase family 4 protein [Candidatus Woesearchaeota archaeon]
MVGKIRIALLAPEFLTPWGGVGTYTVNLAEGLSKYKDIELHIITPMVPGAKKPKHLNIHTLSTANDQFFYNLKFQLAIGRKFKELHERYHFDLIHAANLVHMPDIFLRLRSLDIPSVVTIHTTIEGQIGGFITSNKNPLKMAPSELFSIIGYPYIGLMQYLYLKKTRFAITVSEKFKIMLEHDRRCTARITAIPNGLDTRLYGEKISRAQALKHFPQFRLVKSPVVLYAGRLITQKGIDLYVKSVAQMHKKGIDCFAVIAGRGNEGYVLDLLKEHNIPEEKYMLTGHIEQRMLPYLYRLADIFMLPSYYENFPYSLLEAMSMGCSCIATDVGAVDEIINNKNGLIAPKGDASKLAAHLRALLTDPALMQRLSEQGSKDIRKRFTKDVMVEQTYQYYKEVLNSW